MDILSEFLTKLCIEFGNEMFDQERLHKFELKFRVQNGGDRHYIASPDACIRAKRNADVVRHLRSGGTTASAAERFNLTDRQVRNIRQTFK